MRNVGRRKSCDNVLKTLGASERARKVWDIYWFLKSVGDYKELYFMKPKIEQKRL